MARTPAEEGASATRERVIVAATEAFSEAGFSAMTTRKLAAAASVNLATLNYHFGSKEGLYRACVDTVYERLNSRGAALVPEISAATPKEVLRAFYRLAREERAGVRLLLREVLDHGSLRPATTTAHYLPGLTSWSALLEGLPETYRPATSAHARRALVTLGFLMSRFATQDEAALGEALGLESPEQLEDTILSILETTTLSLMR